jgi:two-component system CheB/CheR fusion protein
MLTTIFDLFAQADNSLDRRGGGLGIGLTVVRGLVDMHGGSIEARSEGLGQGSEFVVRLPLLRESSAVADSLDMSEAEASESEHLPRRVLIVEDNEDAAESLRLLLTGWGHEVHTAADGEKAIEIAGSVQPDVVLLDVGLPGMSGYEVARRLRALPSGERFRVIAMTGYGQEEDRRQSREAGMDAHVVKPVLPKQLSSLLTSATAD